jgi:acetyltransferase-like isoleucine patch superfamily enzyme
MVVEKYVEKLLCSRFLSSRIRCGFYNYFSSISIGTNSFVGENVLLDVTGRIIIIGNDTFITTGSMVLTHSLDTNELGKDAGYHWNFNSGITKIGSKVFIGANTKILGPLNICDNCVIASGSVVTRVINEAGIYAGVPAKKIGDIWF